MKPLKETIEREKELSPTVPRTKDLERDNKGRIKKGVAQETNKNGTAGRPTDYRKEYAGMLLDFMSRTSHEIAINKTYHRTNNGEETGGLKSEKHVVIAETYPTLQRFAHNIGVHIDTLYEWEKVRYSDNHPNKRFRRKLKYPEFSEALKKARQIQESILLENALSGNYNAQFAIFIAKNNFGYKNKSETDLTTNGQNINTTAVDKLNSLISSTDENNG